MSKTRLRVAFEILQIVGQLALYAAVALYFHEFSQQGKQLNEVRRLVEERCR